MKDGATRAREEKERLIAERDKALGKTGEEEVKGDETPVVETPTSDPDPAPADEMTQKYEALLAKYNSEVPRLHSWNREKDEKIASLTAEITELQRQIIELQTKPVAEEVDDDGKVIYRSPHVTDEIRKSDTYQYYLQEFGETHAERQAEMSILAAKNTVKPVEEKVQANAVDTEVERFHRDLNSICPEWQGLNAGINVDAGFIAWLEETLAHDALVKAYESGDKLAMKKIIDKYTSTIKTPEPKPKPGIPEHLASPARAGGGAQTVIDNNQGNIMRMADFEKLYDDFNKGLYQGKEAEYKAKKEEFMKAKAEGRLV